LKIQNPQFQRFQRHHQSKKFHCHLLSTKIKFFQKKKN
jgi:hypothetical protein